MTAFYTARALLPIGRRLAAALLLLAYPCYLPASDGLLLQGNVAAISAPDWRIAQLDFGFEVSLTSVRGRVRIHELHLNAADVSIRNISIDCIAVQLTTTSLRCDKATFAAQLPGAGDLSATGWFVHNSGSGVTRFELQDIVTADGTLSLRGTSDGADSQIEFAGDNMRLTELLRLANEFGAGLESLSAAGFASVTGSLQTDAGEVAKLQLDGELKDASASNEPGTIVADSVLGRFSFSGERLTDGWRIVADVFANGGEAYIEPVYANMSEHSVSVQAAEIVTRDFQTFDVAGLRLEQDSLLTVGGQLQIVLPETDDGDVGLSGKIELTDASLNAMYTGLFQILAAGTIFAELDTAGHISGTVTLVDSAPTFIDLDVYEISLDDSLQRFSIYELNGHVVWPDTGGDTATTELHWASATAYRIPFDGGEVRLRIGVDDVELLDPLRLATMGGAILVNRLVMSDYGSDSATGLLDAELEPIQLGLLTGAFGWPAFSGTLSGRLPLLQYEGNAMTVGGSLTAKAFGGDIEFARLRLEQPFSLVPRLQGDLTLRQIDLELLTNTFSFGLIQGRLSGDVTGLEMIAWQPVAMDMNLYTPLGDKSRHRISQRAVENLASVGGGGAAAVLSGGLLKFFEVFSYDRIGLRCVLKNGACRMSGAGAAGDGPFGSGYYIVKGSGLPRIDVIGYREQVGWLPLMKQLRNITSGSGPVVN